MFIKLTLKDTKYERIFVNTSTVTYIEGMTYGSRVYFFDRDYVSVTESPEEIVRKWCGAENGNTKELSEVRD